MYMKIFIEFPYILYKLGTTAFKDKDGKLPNFLNDIEKIFLKNVEKYSIYFMYTAEICHLCYKNNL